VVQAQPDRLKFMTVRTLVLLRHAKAERPDQVPDLDRPLTDRGHADAAAAGAWLAAQGLPPKLVLCSPARRTRETWHGVRVALGDAAAATDVMFERALYWDGASAILDLIRAAEDTVDVLLVVGHNPSISTVSMLLDPDGQVDGGLRTAGSAVHRLTGQWMECVPGQAPLTVVHTARAAA
jgi:phosphohistidine phosphatase